VKSRGLLFVISCCCLLSGCISRVSIGRIVNDPRRYENKLVRLDGHVTQSVNAIVAGGYQVEDGTGKIVVLSNAGAPRKGTGVSVTGRVSPTVTLLGQPFGTIIRERDRHVISGR
jgi:outer membrane murein-binding lipoprotein Lpp